MCLMLELYFVLFFLIICYDGIQNHYNDEGDLPPYEIFTCDVLFVHL